MEADRPKAVRLGKIHKAASGDRIPLRRQRVSVRMDGGVARSLDQALHRVEGVPPKLDERDRKLTARIDEHILKLAIVYSAIKKQSVVTVEALITAISIGQWLQTTALNAFREVGQDPFGRAEKTVLDIVKSKGKMRRRYLQQWVYKKGINGEILTRVITSLVKNGELKEMDGWVGYVPPGDREGD
jgi:hypothetical protein